MGIVIKHQRAKRKFFPHLRRARLSNPKIKASKYLLTSSSSAFYRGREKENEHDRARWWECERICSLQLCAAQSTFVDPRKDSKTRYFSLKKPRRASENFFSHDLRELFFPERWERDHLICITTLRVLVDRRSERNCPSPDTGHFQAERESGKTELQFLSRFSVLCKVTTTKESWRHISPRSTSVWM